MIERNKIRVDSTGEVFTPIPLVQEILDKLPKELFEDPTKTFLDPACGDGNFLEQVILYKILNGSTFEQSLSTTFGVDLMPDNTGRCRARLLEIGMQLEETTFEQMVKQYGKIVEHNIQCANGLTEWDYENWCRTAGEEPVVEYIRYISDDERPSTIIGVETAKVESTPKEVKVKPKQSKKQKPEQNTSHRKFFSDDW